MLNQGLISRVKELNLDKKTHFSGSSPPEIFIGRQDYPNVYSGILSPVEHGNTEKFSSPESWFKHKYKIEQIMGDPLPSHFLINLLTENNRIRIVQDTEGFLGDNKNFGINMVVVTQKSLKELKESGVNCNYAISPKGNDSLLL